MKCNLEVQFDPYIHKNTKHRFIIQWKKKWLPRKNTQKSPVHRDSPLCQPTGFTETNEQAMFQASKADLNKAHTETDTNTYCVLSRG